MSLQLDPVEVTEDLKAFERRLTEYISGLHPKAVRWRKQGERPSYGRVIVAIIDHEAPDILQMWLLAVVLAMSSVCTMCSAWFWITDENTAKVSFMESIWSHKFFLINIIILILLLLIGIHKRVREPQTILKRCRLVLEDYNMSCDDRGRLILRPRTSIKDKFVAYPR